MHEVMAAAVAKKVLAFDQELEGVSLLTNKRLNPGVTPKASIKTVAW